MTTSDIELAHMAGAKSVHLFGLPKPPPQQQRSTKRTSGANALVAAAAAKRNVALLHFDTIQELLDDVLDLEPTSILPPEPDGVVDRGETSFVK